MSFTGEEMYASAGEAPPSDGLIKDNVGPANLSAKERAKQAEVYAQGLEVERKLRENVMDAKAKESRNAELAHVKQIREDQARRIPSYNVSQPISQQAIAAASAAVTEQFAALLSQLQAYRRQLFEIATASNITRRAIFVSPNGSQIVYNPSENLAGHVKERLSSDAKKAILNGFGVTDEQFQTLVGRITATNVMDDSFLTDLARRVRMDQDVFLSLKREILAKKATIEDLNRSIRRVSDVILSLSKVYSDFTAPAEKTRETALAVRGYKPTVTVPVTPEGAVIPAKRSWFGFFTGQPKRGGARRYTVKRRAASRSTKSRLTRSRSRKQSSGGRAGTHRQR